MNIFPEKFAGRLIPTDGIPEFYSKNGNIYETKTNKKVKKSFITEKQKYIGAFLDGYFENINLEYGIEYVSMINNAIDKAEKKWKKYKNQKL